MVNVGALAPPDLPETVYNYPSPVLTATVAAGTWGTTPQVTLKRTQGVKRYTLIGSALTLAGGTTPTSTVSATNPIATHIQIQADDDTLFDVDMIPWLEYQRLVTNQAAAATGFEFDIDMCDVDYRRRGELLPATLLRSFQYNSVVMNITLPASATITSGSPTTVTATFTLTETDVNRDLIDKLPVFVVKKLGGQVAFPIQNAANALTTALPQTGLLKAIFMAAQTAASATYANLSDTVITNWQLILNDSFNETSTTWLMLKRHNRSLFGANPATGYALKHWSPTGETGQLLNISDVRKVTSVNVNVTEGNVGTTGVLYVIRFFYK